MITKETYEIMENNYGDVASWAIWQIPGDTPKSNTSDMSVFNAPDLTEKLNPNFIFVGLNGSSTHGNWMGDTYRPWMNFHSGYSRQNDYKLRYALMKTKYWGSYITDIIKNHPEVDSGKVRKFLKEHPEVVAESIASFMEEISHLAPHPMIVAMGGDTYNILKDHLPASFCIVKVTHYSFSIGKEAYREHVLSVLDSATGENSIKALTMEKTIEKVVHKTKSREERINTSRCDSSHKERYEELFDALCDLGYDVRKHHKFDIDVRLSGKKAISIYTATDSYKIYTNRTEWMEKSSYAGVPDEHGYTHYYAPTLSACIEEIRNFCVFFEFWQQDKRISKRTTSNNENSSDDLGPYILILFTRNTGKIIRTLEADSKEDLIFWGKGHTSKTRDCMVFHKKSGDVLSYFEGHTQKETTEGLGNVEKYCRGLLKAVNED